MDRCEQCGEKLRVKDVRRFNDETYRRRACPECGRCVFTVEYEVVTNDAFWASWYAADADERTKRKGKRNEA